MSEIAIDPPVGLFGVVMKVKTGLCCLICACASFTLSEKSAFRTPSIHAVPVTLAISGCIEYEGVKPRATPLPKAKKMD